MADPQSETPGTTHTYVAIVWYKDWQTWFNILSVLGLLLQEKDIITVIPERYHAITTALVTAVNLILRFTITTRPVALSSGTSREVQSIQPKRVLPIILLALLLPLTGCASMGGARHRATVTVVSAHAVLSAIQDGERMLACGASTAPAPPACVPADTHRAISRQLVTAFDYDGQIASIVRALPAGAELPANVSELVGKVAALVDQILSAIPNSQQKASLTAKIGAQ